MLKNSFNEDSDIKETWKDIKGYEGRYQVSDIGRVKSLERRFVDKRGYKRTIRGQILRPSTEKDGYLQVYLYKGDSDKGKNFFVHRLVCKSFHENPKNKPEVNHINEDKLDNRACNLEWVTRKENANNKTNNLPYGERKSQLTYRQYMTNAHRKWRKKKKEGV